MRCINILIKLLQILLVTYIVLAGVLCAINFIPSYIRLNINPPGQLEESLNDHLDGWTSFIYDGYGVVRLYVMQYQYEITIPADHPEPLQQLENDFDQELSESGWLKIDYAPCDLVIGKRSPDFLREESRMWYYGWGDRSVEYGSWADWVCVAVTPQDANTAHIMVLTIRPSMFTKWWNYLDPFF